MKVIVCGAGQVGFNIAKQLAAEHNDVTVIDHSAELIRNLFFGLPMLGWGLMILILLQLRRHHIVNRRGALA